MDLACEGSPKPLKEANSAVVVWLNSFCQSLGSWHLTHSHPANNRAASMNCLTLAALLKNTLSLHCCSSAHLLHRHCSSKPAPQLLPSLQGKSSRLTTPSLCLHLSLLTNSETPFFHYEPPESLNRLWLSWYCQIWCPGVQRRLNWCCQIQCPSLHSIQGPVQTQPVCPQGPEHPVQPQSQRIQRILRCWCCLTLILNLLCHRQYYPTQSPHIWNLPESPISPEHEPSGRVLAFSL